MITNNVDSILIRSLYFCITAMVIFQLFSFSLFISVLFHLTFIFVLLLWISSMSREADIIDVLCFLILVLTFVNIILNAIIENSSINFTYFKKMIMFFSTLITFRVAFKIRIRLQEYIFLKKCIGIIACLFVLMYVFNNDGMRTFANASSNYLTFNFTNPNLTGMFLFCFVVVEVIFLFQTSIVKERVFHGVMVALLSWFIFETEARNAVITWVIFSIITVVFFFKKETFNIRIHYVFACIVSVFPYIFSVVYMKLNDNSWLFGLFNFIISEGKLLTSRTWVWSKALNMIDESPIIGAYSQISMGTGQSQLHNTHLDIMASYGVLVFALVCLFLSLVIYNKGVTYKSKQSFFAMMGFMCVILLGNGEAALFSGGFGLNYFAAIPLLLMNFDYNNKSLQKIGVDIQ